jgi:hypothetical protein
MLLKERVREVRGMMTQNITSSFESSHMNNVIARTAKKKRREEKRREEKRREEKRREEKRREEKRREERHTCRRRRGVSSSCTAVFSLDHHYPHQEGLIRSCMTGTGRWNGMHLDPSCSAPDGRGSDIWWRRRAQCTQERESKGREEREVC